jgi:hypothetical protein
MSIDAVNALTTLIKAKAWLGVAPAPDTTDDDEIEKLIDSVSWQYNSFTKRRLLARDLTEYYEGDGTPVFLSPEYPINTITTLHIDSERAYGADTLINSAKYTFDKQGFIKLDESTFSTSPKAVKLVYNVGYATIPLDLNVACLDQIKWLFRRHIKNEEGITTEATINGSVTVTEVGEILETALKVLERYRRRDHV